MGGQTDAEQKSNVHLAYERVGESYEAITEFRAKLLALLPLATGTGVFLLLERAQKETNGSQFQRFLGPIGIFGVVVTLGLFAYELRGMQRCHRLEVQGSVLENDLNLSVEQGPFLGQPRRALGNMLGPPAAGLTIYLATTFTWLWLAGFGFRWWGWSYAWGFLVGYAVVLTVTWIALSKWLGQSATGGLPHEWKKYVLEMPPMKPNWMSGLDDARKKVMEAARRQELAAELDRAEQEYLTHVYNTLADNRIEAATRSRQRANVA
jgi:hypothetical protein